MKLYNLKYIIAVKTLNECYFSTILAKFVIVVKFISYQLTYFKLQKLEALNMLY